MLENLLLDHKSIIRQIRKDIDRAEHLGDIGTADFLTCYTKNEKIGMDVKIFYRITNSLTYSNFSLTNVIERWHVIL